MKSQSARRKAGKTRSKRIWPTGALFGVLVLSSIAYGRGAFDRPALVPASPQALNDGAVRFTDARRQAAEFISYDDSIVLNSDQKKLMNEALSSIPAPCCAQYSIATCCCPCNLARSTWGLSKSLIATQHADAAQVRAAVSAWLQFTNPRGYTGDACFTKRCNRSFANNGCGGMDSGHVQ